MGRNIYCRYKQEFGFIIPDREVLVDDVRVRGIGRSRIDLGSASDKKATTPKPEKASCNAFCRIASLLL